MPTSDHASRKTAVLVLGILSLIVLLLLLMENAFNLKFLSPHNTDSILVFTAISVLSFLLFLTVLLLLLRNILKLYGSEQSRVLGSRLRTRMLVGALLLSLIPAVFMVFFNYLLMNNSIDRWFSQPGIFLREQSMQIAIEMAHYATDNARAEAESISNAIVGLSSGNALNNQQTLDEMHHHKITLQGGFAVLFRDGKYVSAYQLPSVQEPATIDSWIAPVGSVEQAPAGQPLVETILHDAQRPDEPILQIDSMEYALGAASAENGAVVVVGLPLPPDVGNAIRSIRTGTQTYWALFQARRRIRTTYLLVLMLLSVLTFFISSWLALFLSKQVTRPVEVLADSMDAIASGDYGHRADIAAAGELGELVRSFNHMASDLETSRTQLERSTQQLSAVNAALEARRRELETVLETIPSGVAVLDSGMRIVQANRAFCEMLDPQGERTFEGLAMLSLFSLEVGEEIQRAMRRSLRLSTASTEVEADTAIGLLQLAFTVAPLHGAAEHGYLVVLDNVTELLLVQKQTAWKEVAQRVAHEIKNPLTPIALSAERIQRHLDRTDSTVPSDSKQMIRSATDVIRSSVETMRLLVDQFSALADFPVAHPRPVVLNQIVEDTLRVFSGRLEGIEVKLRLEPQMPPVMADPEALKRALTSLVDNAAEAMQESLVRALTVQTCLNESQTMAEIVVTDTGHGLTEEIRERLFLPFFSTRRRGTGLGLSIAAKIVQEHHGNIRAEKNKPAGARFIVELPLADPAQTDVTESIAGHEATR
ncbi:MAG TPA: ATP-binding protein [Acidobacteriaceae bacterium]|nr:ATP-binding protein [Acidobacteriaceae bacterium]